MWAQKVPLHHALDDTLSIALPASLLIISCLHVVESVSLATSKTLPHIDSFPFITKEWVNHQYCIKGAEGEEPKIEGVEEKKFIEFDTRDVLSHSLVLRRLMYMPKEEDP